MRALFSIVLAALCLAMLAVPALKAARPVYGQVTAAMAADDSAICAETTGKPAPVFKPCGKQANSVATLCHVPPAVLPAQLQLPTCPKDVPNGWVAETATPPGLVSVLFRPPRLA